MSSFLILACGAYLAGSIPWGKIIGLLRGVDLQKTGSGNIGFANAYRVLGARYAIWVLIGDVLKGYVPTLMAINMGLDIWQIFGVGILAVVGHVFPIWLRFKGGKGMATGLGLLLAISPIVAGLAVGVWLVVLNWTKMFSVASLAGAWTAVVMSMAVVETRPYTLGIAVIAVVGTWFHKDNIKRIIAGREPRSWKW